LGVQIKEIEMGETYSTNMRGKTSKILARKPEIPNIVAEWLALLNRTPEGTRSNLDKETCYPDRIYAVFPSS
jgi:hypothetical protein